MKAAVENRCVKVLYRLRENMSGLQTKTTENTLSIREKQRNNRNAKMQQKQRQHT